MRVVVFMFLLMSHYAYADLLFVGTGSGQCIYTNIQDAIDHASPDSEIRVTNELGPFIENVVIDKNLTIKGGYSSCGLAQLDERNYENLTQINGGHIGTSLIITGSGLTVNFSGFELTDGVGLSLAGGGASVLGSGHIVNFSHIMIGENSSQLGGGIFMSGASELILIDTKIHSNTSISGGGVFCMGEGNIRFFKGTGVYQNYAVNGGGVYATNSCDIRVAAGEVHSTELSPVGISSNTALDYGGGIYLNQSSLDLRSNELNSFLSINVDNNLANSDGENGGGGAIYAKNSWIDSSYAYFYNNRVYNGHGGAVHLHDSVIVSNFVNYERCLLYNDECSWFEMNQAKQVAPTTAGATFGGAIYATDDSFIASQLGNHFQGYFINNTADFASAITLTNASTARIQNSFFINNGQSGFFDTADRSTLGVYGFGSEAQISFSTFANNNTSSVFNVVNTGAINLVGSIVYELNFLNSVVSNELGGEFDFICGIFHEGTTIGDINVSDTSIITYEPGFIDSENLNFRLREDSVALDRCSIIGVDEGLVHHGRELEPRPYDLNDVDNGIGHFDVGADELFPYEFDSIFKNDFE